LLGVSFFFFLGDNHGALECINYGYKGQGKLNYVKSGNGQGLVLEHARLGLSRSVPWPATTIPK